MTKLRILPVIFMALALQATAADSDNRVTKTLVWPDGTRYVGGVVDGKRSGRGTIFWQDGTRFVGQFENDMRNGPGTMILPDGTVYTGFFKDDELVDTETTLAASLAAEMDQETMDELGDAELPAEADALSALPAEEPARQPSTSGSTPLIEPEGVAETDLPEPANDAPVAQEIASAAIPATDDRRPADVVEDQVPATDIIEANAPAADVVAAVELSTDVTEITDAVKQQLIESVDRWASAWSDQDVTAYLASYSADFAVPGKQSRRNWEALRKTRLQRPRFIDINLEYQGFELVEPNVIDVFIRQAYESNTYSDLTDKVLRLQREDSNWRILNERSR